jgi:antitoxin (DNA-binding transcriptional repressor) of toxin-antitoxin stability system
MTTLTISEARAALPELLSRVEDGEEITITRHGRVVAVMVRPDVLRARRADRVLADAEQVHHVLSTARSTPLPAAGEVTVDRAEELIADIRTGRQAR